MLIESAWCRSRHPKAPGTTRSRSASRAEPGRCASFEERGVRITGAAAWYLASGRDWQLRIEPY